MFHIFTWLKNIELLIWFFTVSWLYIHAKIDTTIQALVLQEERKAKFLCICTGSFILISYFFGVLSSQSGIPFSMGGMLTKLSGESAAALMSLLGASIMPHNFYLHSSIIKVPLFSVIFFCVVNTCKFSEIESGLLTTHMDVKPCITLQFQFASSLTRFHLRHAFLPLFFAEDMLVIIL